MWIGAYFGGLIMLMMFIIVSAIINPEETRKVVYVLILAGIIWPISFPLIVFFGNNHLKK